MKVIFLRKAMSEQLIPNDEFIVEKTVIIEKDLFNQFVKFPLDSYDFIKENINLMYCDCNYVYHCIFVTSNEHDYGILIESEGYDYARYSAYLPKVLINNERS